MLGAGEQRADRGRLHLDGGGDFVVARAVAAEDQQGGVAGVEGGEDAAHLFALLFRGVEILGGWDRCRGFRLTFVFLAALAAAEVVESEPKGGSVEPSAGMIAMGLGGPPELPESVDGDLLGAAGVADDPGDGARDPRVMGVEERLEVERAGWASVGSMDIWADRIWATWV